MSAPSREHQEQGNIKEPKQATGTNGNTRGTNGDKATKQKRQIMTNTNETSTTRSSSKGTATRGKTNTKQRQVETRKTRNKGRHVGKKERTK